MYSNTTKQVSASDHVFATLKQNGKVLANLSRSNFVSLSDVIETVKKLVGKLSGMYELNIRTNTKEHRHDACSPQFIFKAGRGHESIMKNNSIALWWAKVMVIPAIVVLFFVCLSLNAA